MENLIKISKKLIISGDSGVGKTTIIHRLLTNEFITDTQSTIAYDIKILDIKWDDKIISLKIWDTAGQDEYKYIFKNYYHDAKIIIFCFNLTEKLSFNNIEKWINSAKEIVDVNEKNTLIIGNKSDLIDKIEVSEDDIQKLISKYNWPFFKFSSKDNTNLELKEKILSIFHENLKNEESENIGFEKINKDQNKKSACCFL